jgi:hypothetical protein
MRVLHLNTNASGGSYEYAALLSTALAEQGIDSHILCKSPPSSGNGRPLLDRVIRRSVWNAADCCLRRRPRIWKEWMWCICTAAGWFDFRAWAALVVKEG